MVYRVFVEKKPGLAHEAQTLKNDIRSLLGIEALTDLRLFNRSMLRIWMETFWIVRFAPSFRSLSWIP